MRIKQKQEDEVLDELIREVKSVHQHNALITALGNKAMQPRHWNKVFALLDVPSAGGMSQTIVLDQLIKDRAEDHIEEIEDISGAA